MKLGWQGEPIAAAGTGGIGGSTGATDNRLLRSDGAGGATVQNSPIAVTDAGAMSGVTTISATSATFSSSPIAAGYLVYDGGPGGDEKVQVAASFLLANDTHIKFYNDADISSGAADLGLARGAAGYLALTDGSTGGSGLELTEVSAPAAPAANKARLFLHDNGSGKTQLAIQFPTGAVQVIATEP